MSDQTERDLAATDAGVRMAVDLVRQELSTWIKRQREVLPERGEAADGAAETLEDLRRELDRIFGEQTGALDPYCPHGNPPTWCHTCNSHIRPSEGIFRRLDCLCCYGIDEVTLQALLEETWPVGHADDCYCARCHAAAMGGGA
jgi:hypothetical protein